MKMSKPLLTDEQFETLLKKIRLELKKSNCSLIQYKRTNSFTIKTSEGDHFMLCYFDSTLTNWSSVATLGDRPPCRARDFKQKKVESHISHCVSVFLNELT